MNPRPSNRLRIIGGDWRGRRLAFPDAAGLRPTPDRVRETLFNWLAPVIAGSRCLDLFAGSGALGLESLSRGAREAVFVEQQAEAAGALRRHLQVLGAEDRGRVVQQPVEVWLRGEPRPFDIVFLDPPYHAGLLAPTVAALAAGWVTPGGHVYFEHAADEPTPEAPPGWILHRRKRAGAVIYGLWLAGAGRGVPEEG